jgi:hypothetical protein
MREASQQWQLEGTTCDEPSGCFHVAFLLFGVTLSLLIHKGSRQIGLYLLGELVYEAPLVLKFRGTVKCIWWAVTLAL